MAHVLYGLACADEAMSSHLLNDFRLGGEDHLMVVADFDYTLTIRRGECGEKGCLTHEVFDEDKEVEGTDSTVGELQRRMNKNYQKAYSVCSSDEERAFVNNGWWNASHDLIIRSNMHRDDIPNLVRCSRLIWRRKIHHFFELLERSSIPLLIYSAGITDIINEAIRQLLGRVPSNIAIAANVMCFNEDGYVYGFTNPPLHSLCKNITRLRELIPGVDQKYAKRTNVLVIGDTDSDASMVDGWKGKCVLKVGLEAEEKPTLKRFDVVIKGSDCSRLIDVVRFILSPQQL